MKFYSHYLFPRGMNAIMSNQQMAKERKELLKDINGSILEVGFGTGLNLPHYPEPVKEITTIDNNPGMGILARERLKTSTIKVKQLVLSAEDLPIEDNTFDNVVSTWTLCSIKNVGQAIAEIKRVLKPGGKLHFIEHGLSCDERIKRWQIRLNPLQKIIGDGCNLTRDIKKLIERGGFKLVEYKNFYIENEPRTHAYTYKGVGIKKLQ